MQETRKKEAEKLVKAGKVRRKAGRGMPPVASTTTYLSKYPWPFSGLQITISAVCRAYESEQCKQPSNAGTACCRLQPKALLLQLLLRLLQVQMF